MFSKIGLTNNPLAIILPSLVSPFGIYLMRIYAEASVPSRADRGGADRRRGRVPHLPQDRVPAARARLRDRAAVHVRGDVEQLLPAAGDAVGAEVVPAHRGARAVERPGQRRRRRARSAFNLVITGALISVVPLIIAFVFLQRLLAERPGRRRREGLSRAARAFLRSDAPSLSLDGDWAFRFSAARGRRRWTSSTAASTTRLGPAAGARRTGSCTATARRPTRTSSTRSRSTRRTSRTRTRRATTGARFDVPGDVGGRRTRCCASRASTRACGCGSTASSSATSTGSRLPTEFDVGAAAAPGRGQRARGARAPVVGRARYLEDQDMWWLSGIFRERRRCSRGPAGAIDDVFVHADYDHVTGSGHAARRHRRAGARVTVPELGHRRRRPARRSRLRGRAVERRAPAALRRRGGERGRARARCGSASARVVVEDGLLQVNGQPRPAPRRQPPRVRPRPRPRGVARTVMRRDIS